MQTIAYLRVSTGGQDLAQQRLAILDYARKQRLTVHDFVELQSSAQRAAHKEQLFELIETLQKGDRLLVSELSRLGRSLSQILQVVERLIHNGVRLVTIKEGISFEGKQTLQTKAMIALFGLFAEIERDLISRADERGLGSSQSERQAAGPPQRGVGQVKARWERTRNSRPPAEAGVPSLDCPDCGSVPNHPPSLHQNKRAGSEETAARLAQRNFWIWTGPLSVGFRSNDCHGPLTKENEGRHA
jgi:DNA invertase Pin-like site-specific DNA recombinase